MAILEIAGTSAGVATLLQLYRPQYSLGIVANTFILFFLSVTVFKFYEIVIWPRYVSPLKNLPTPPNNHWLFGQTKTILAEPSGIPQRRWADEIPNDGLIYYQAFGRGRVLITNPAALSEVMVTKNYEFQKPWELRHGLGRILGIGILLAEGDEHKRQRKALMPAFNFRHIKDLTSSFWDKSREFMEALAEASKSKDSIPQPINPRDPKSEVIRHAPGIIDVGSWSSRATLDIIGVSGMGQDFGAIKDENSELAVTYHSIFKAQSGRGIMRYLGFFISPRILRMLPVKANQDIDKAMVYIKKTCYDLIAQKKKAMEKGGRKDIDIISVAIESGGFSDEDLVNQMMTFLLAGHETTATSMQWAIYLLCRHQDVQRRLREEIRSKCPSLDSNITASDIDNLHYLQAVCNEVFRLWAPVALTLRNAAVDSSINGHFIPKGTTIIISPWAINGSKSLWGDDALEFKPERWLDADGKANNKGSSSSNYAFMTFLHGPRSCIGQRFAHNEFACLLAAWVGRFETNFEEGSDLAKGQEPALLSMITTKPKGGIWVRLKELDGW